jgi:hypothetical protein
MPAALSLYQEAARVLPMRSLLARTGGTRRLRGASDRHRNVEPELRAYSAMVWLRLRPRTMSRYVRRLIAGAVFHFSGAEIYSRSSPELASGLLEPPECKGRRRFRAPAGATLRPPRTKMFFYDLLAHWPSKAPLCREKSTRISPSSYPFENHAPQATLLAIFSLS